MRYVGNGSRSIIFSTNPLRGLDVQTAKLIRQTVRDLNRIGCTVFLTTQHERGYRHLVIMLPNGLPGVCIPSCTNVNHSSKKGRDISKHLKRSGLFSSRLLTMDLLLQLNLYQRNILYRIGYGKALESYNFTEFIIGANNGFKFWLAYCFH